MQYAVYRRYAVSKLNKHQVIQVEGADKVFNDLRPRPALVDVIQKLISNLYNTFYPSC